MGSRLFGFFFDSKVPEEKLGSFLKDHRSSLTYENGYTEKQVEKLFPVINRETKFTTESETELSSTDKREVLTGREQENTTDTDDATEPITDRRDDSIADG